ncbi:MAG: hypothetical protein ACKO7R_19765 [Pseudanabaena sp.]
MTLTLKLPSEVEEYLLQEANQKGLSIESVTLELLASFILLRQKQSKAVNLIQSWIDDEDIEEQQETGQYLISALDEDRLSDRKLFPVE